MWVGIIITLLINWYIYFLVLSKQSLQHFLVVSKTTQSTFRMFQCRVT